MALDQKCVEMIAAQQTLGDFIDINKARQRINAYFGDEGVTQLNKADANHVYGYLLGLPQLEKFMANIKAINDDPTTKEPINAVRIYRAKQPKDGDILPDLVLVPVKRDGEDFPVAVTKELTGSHYLAGAGPCPNVCSPLYII